MSDVLVSARPGGVLVPPEDSRLMGGPRVDYFTSFTAPFTPKGLAGLMPSLPRDQAVAGLTVHFRMDPDAHRRYLPPPLEPDPDHPGEALWLYAHHVATPVAEDCSEWHPDRLAATEGLLGLVCRYNGVTGTYYWYNWVDNDWDLLVLWLYGYPGKLGRMAITPSHPEHPYLNGPRPGAKYVATIDRTGSRVVSAKVTLDARCPLDEFPIKDLLRAYGVRHIPNLDLRAKGKPLAHDLVCEHQESLEAGDIWRGTGELRFHEAENEELLPLQPTEVIAAYHMRFKYRTSGIDVLYDYLSDEHQAPRSADTGVER